MDSKGNELKNEDNQSLYEILATQHEHVYIKLNDNLHSFSQPQASNHVEFSLGTDSSFLACQKKGLSAAHATTLSTFMNQFHHQVEARHGKV
jgi:hypothetical protein